jgi:hypothetical protein
MTKRSLGKRRVWSLTKRECEAQTPPHRLQLVVSEGFGNSQLCALCGTTLVKAKRPACRSSRRSPPLVA